MAGLTFSYRVIENGPRNFIFVANGVNTTTTTVAFTPEATVTGIIAAAGYTPTVHLKVRRLLWSLGNYSVQLQWHQTANVDLLYLSGWLDWNMKDTQGIPNPGGAGSTGDIDLIAIPTVAVTTGGGVVGGTASIWFECIKGVGTAAG